jgi:hypothetical protein
MKQKNAKFYFRVLSNNSGLARTNMTRLGKSLLKRNVLKEISKM